MTGFKSLVVAQTGGPSAVINSTLAGIIEEARIWPEIKEVIGCISGYHGLFCQNIIKLADMSTQDLKRLRNTPGAFLGSSRMPLTPADFAEIPVLLSGMQAGYYLQIGGNGTMYAANTISEKVREAGLDIQVIGVPKTVDNDIAGLDHCPGFSSAAKYVAQATLDMGIDLWSMRTFEQVRIIEVMGRNVGWLAASSGLAKGNEDHAPHLIYLPEVTFDEDEFIEDVKRIVKRLGYAIVVVGEGIKDKNHCPIGDNPFAEVKCGSQVYGGASSYLAGKVSKALNIKARAQDLGMTQRCFTPLRSEVDELEAYNIGRAAVRAAVNRQGGNMVGLSGIATAGNSDYFTLPLIEVGGKEKKVPAHFYNQDTKQVTREFVSWLKPLLGKWEPDYLRLENLIKHKERGERTN